MRSRRLPRSIARVALIAWLLVASPAIASEPLDLAAFRERLAGEMRAANPGATVAEVDAQTLRIRRANGEDATVAVENAHAEYLADPARLGSVLAKWARIGIAEASPLTARDAERLVVVLRAAEPLAASGVPAVTRPFAGDLAEVLAFDSPETLRYVVPDDLKLVGLSVEAAFARGRANLRERMGPVNIGQVAGEEEGLAAVSAASGLATGTLTTGAMCSAARGAGMHVLVVDRDGYVFGVERDRRGMGAVRRFVARLGASKAGLSATPLRCAKGAWVADQPAG